MRWLAAPGESRRRRRRRPEPSPGQRPARVDQFGERCDSGRDALRRHRDSRASGNQADEERNGDDPEAEPATADCGANRWLRNSERMPRPGGLGTAPVDGIALIERRLIARRRPRRRSRRCEINAPTSRTTSASSTVPAIAASRGFSWMKAPNMIV